MKKHSIITICGMISALIVSIGVCIVLTSISNTKPWIDYWNAPNKISYDNPSLKIGTHCEIRDGEELWYPNNWNMDTYAKRVAQTCLVIDGTTHDAMDHSFNQSVLQGESNFIKQDNSSTSILTDTQKTKPSSDSPQGFINTYNALEDKGVENLLLSGFIHASPLADWVKRTQHTSGAIFIDGDVQSKYVSNILFRADESAFMTGLAIGQYLNENFTEYIKDGQLSVGTFGGLSIPTVTIFMGGLELGIWTYNEILRTHWDVFEAIGKQNWGWGDSPLKQHEIKFASLGITDSFFSGDFAQGDGRSVVQELLARKVSCILPVAGPQTFDAVQEIVNQRSHCVVIGVDTPQEDDPTVQRHSVYLDKSGSSNVIKFSAEKNITTMVYDILCKIMHKDTDQDFSKVGPYGYLTVGNIDNEGVKSSNASAQYLANFFNTWKPNSVSTNTIEETFEDVYSIIKTESITTPIQSYSSWLDMIDNNMNFRC